jgi:alpha-beta hydrolase superfamily lysophospholipase
VSLIDLPDGVRRKASALGDAGQRWIDDLDQVVAQLEAEWQLRVGATLGGGSGGYVASAVTADGTSAVLKVAIPDGLVGNSNSIKSCRRSRSERDAATTRTRPTFSRIRGTPARRERSS